MSVFGGDSWAREAQDKKMRVEDLLADDSSFRKLSNGKYVCVVCPNNPVLDSPLLFSMHRNGCRHRAAESRLKETEIMRQHEMNKRLAVSDGQYTMQNSSNHRGKHRSTGKPLIEYTKQAASQMQNDIIRPSSRVDCKPNSQSAQVANPASNSIEASSCVGSDSVESDKVVVQQHFDFRERRERELKFTAAGWKRDCHGKWYKDDNVEFDSDEEDPNVCLV